MIALLAIVAVAWLIALATIASGTGLLGGDNLIKRVTPARHSGTVARRVRYEKACSVEESPFDLESYAGGGSDWFPPGASGCDLGGES